MQMTIRDWALLISLSILWGGAFFFAAIAVKQIPPLTLVFCRVSLAALTLFIFLKFKRQKLPKDLNIWAAFFIMGLLNNIIPFSLLFWAQTLISSGLASIINATTPIFAILVAHFALADEKLTSHKIIGVVLGFVGVAILMGTDVISSENIAIWGIVACLGAALSYGIASVYARRFKAMNISPSTGAFGQLVGSSLIMLPIIMFFDKPWLLPLPSMNVISAIIILAIASTALAYLIYFHLLATVGAVNASSVTLLVPVSAIILGTLFLSELLKTQHYIGMLLILAGLLAIDGRMLKMR